MIRPSRDPLHLDQRLTEVEDMIAQMHLKIMGRDTILSQVLAEAAELPPENQAEMFSSLPQIYDEMDRKITEDYRQALARHQESAHHG